MIYSVYQGALHGKGIRYYFSTDADDSERILDRIIYLDWDSLEEKVITNRVPEIETVIENTRSDRFRKHCLEYYFWLQKSLVQRW